MELIKKVNGDSKQDLLNIDRLYAGEVQDTQEKEIIWILYNNAYTQILEFQDGGPPAPAFSLYNTPMRFLIPVHVVNEGRGLRNKECKRYWDITQEIKKVEGYQSMDIIQLSTQILSKVPSAEVMGKGDDSEKPSVSIMVDEVTDYFVWCSYNTRPVIYNDGDYTRVVGVILLEKNQGEVNLLSPKEKELEEKMLKHLREDLLKGLKK